ncbi:MAG: hypothetical protein IJR14_09055 [Synergistaceae bacterium]|nr:hypothetical protein [Synergistaceae bacterium]
MSKKRSINADDAEAMDFECSANGRVVRALDEERARRLLRCEMGCSVLKSGRCTGPGPIGGTPAPEAEAEARDERIEAIEDELRSGAASPEAVETMNALKGERMADRMKAAKARKKAKAKAEPEEPGPTMADEPEPEAEETEAGPDDRIEALKGKLSRGEASREELLEFGELADRELKARSDARQRARAEAEKASRSSLVEAVRTALRGLAARPHIRSRLSEETLAMMGALGEEIEAARAAGWGWSTIAKAFRGAGAKISEDTLRRRFGQKQEGGERHAV